MNRKDIFSLALAAWPFFSSASFATELSAPASPDSGVALAAAAPINLDGAKWIWCDEPGADATRNAPVGKRFFRRDITLDGTATVVRAWAVFSADNHFKLNLNGQLLGGSDIDPTGQPLASVDSWRYPVKFDITAALHPGRNLILVEQENDPASGEINAAGLIGKIHIQRADGSQQDLVTDAEWESSPESNADSWKKTRVLGDWNMLPWAAISVEGLNYPVLTNAAQVRDLTQDQAAKSRRVRVRGVTVSGEAGRVVLVDESSGIYCEGQALQTFGLHPGNVLEVEGVTDPGRFSPYVRVYAARKVGESPIPKPRQVTYDDLRDGSWDGQWVEITGVVREAGDRDSEITLFTGGARMSMGLTKEQIEQAKVGAKIQLSGVCYYQYNEFRQVVRPILAVPPSERITILDPAPEDIFRLAVSPIRTLLEFNPKGAQGRCKRVQGVVTQVQPGVGFWITDGEQGAHVLTRQKQSLHLGDNLDVVGFLNCEDGFPVLEDARYQLTGKSSALVPIPLETPAQTLKHNGALVALAATIRSQSFTPEGIRLEMETGAEQFTAFWPDHDEKSAPATWQPGARVRVTGVSMATLEAPSLMPGALGKYALKLILRSPADVQILQAAPWWTATHVAWALGVIVGALVLLLSAVFALARHRLRQQAIARMKSEAEFAAVFNERNRLARELHDTLAQGLSAISVELEVAKRRLPEPGAARKSLEIVSDLARANLKEARSWIWNMRSQVLETGDLATALADVLRNLTEGTKTRGSMRTRGTIRRLAPVTENNVLRIGQEAITNAAKYAQAETLQVALEFEDQQMRLTVADDGKGFNVAHPPPSEGGFGLVGMRERAAQLHAELTITSEPGEGTMVTLSVPLPREFGHEPVTSTSQQPDNEDQA